MALINDSEIRRELQEIADYIRALRSEIGALQANDLRHKRIPAAGRELEAIVKATEEASNTIMECAEAAMTAAANSSDLEAYKSYVAERMTAVFEACAFQDLTGQRLSKVVDTLHHIEARLSRFADATSAKDAGGHANEKEEAAAERKLRLLIHGPQHDGEGVEQHEVDQLIEDEPKKSTQEDIDRLFA